jgi:hypothetical protein
MAGLGRLGTVTKGRFRESEFNVSFPAMNLMSGRSTPDPFLTATLLQSGRSGKSGFRICGLHSCRW